MLTDVGTWTNWLTFEPDPVNPDAGTDCFLRYRISHATQNFTSGKSDVYVLVAAARRGFTMVLFTEAVSRRNTFVGGTCAPASALLVCCKLGRLHENGYSSTWNFQMALRSRHYVVRWQHRAIGRRWDFLSPAPCDVCCLLCPQPQGRGQ